MNEHRFVAPAGLVKWKRTAVAAALALGFRVTGRRRFLEAFHRRRDLLLSRGELAAIATRLRERPGSLLVFGAGNDSILWHVANGRRNTAILESDPDWIDLVGREWPSLRLYPVKYVTRLADARLPEKQGLDPPVLELPEPIRQRRWDAIIVDAPQGWGDGPGRLQSIYEASRLIAPDGRIFVHDCDREGERYLVARYLGHLRCTELSRRLWLFET